MKLTDKQINIIARKVAENLGQPLPVTNKPAGGTTGQDFRHTVFASPADGIFATIDEAVAAAEEAFLRFSALKLEKRAQIIASKLPQLEPGQSPGLAWDITAVTNLRDVGGDLDFGWRLDELLSAHAGLLRSWEQGDLPGRQRLREGSGRWHHGTVLRTDEYPGVDRCGGGRPSGRRLAAFGRVRPG